MSNNKKQLGILGEDLAAKYLKKNGYKILHRNYRLKTGEIDIIARQGKDLVFIEVKTRQNSRLGSPASAVTKQKQLHIIRVAEEYLARHDLFECSARFDVVAVLMEKETEPVIEIIPNAFETLS